MHNKVSRFPWRRDELAFLLYRLGLAYVFYALARLLFVIYNAQQVQIEDVATYLSLQFHGMAFDTTAILYVNALFIVASIIPTTFNSTGAYQKGLFRLYFICNLIAYATNFVDFIYYRFNFGRSTRASFDVLQNESNKAVLFANFAVHYWHVVVLFVGCSWLWIWMYKKGGNPSPQRHRTPAYFVYSLLVLSLTTVLAVGGIRGDFKKSTRPINLVDANRYVSLPDHADVVLNTPFALIRTWDANAFQKEHFMAQNKVNALVKPIKHYAHTTTQKPNIVVFILESFGREYIGAFNKGTHIPNYRSYTPFVDSLAQHSLIYTNAYANGYKSIHGMSSVLAGIPSFQEAFTSSPYPKQKITSLVSELNALGYDTSFFHGAPNGSMGFLGFGNILGFDHYYGKTEYNNDADFDGVWGIWDEPFFQYMKRTLDGKKQPFMATLFSVTSHEPYQIPKQYEGKFPKGTVNIHQCIGYTDFALKRFFQEASKQPWFNNTIFVMVADHDNTIAYDEYCKELYQNTVPILFFSPQHQWKGSHDEWAQQIDIFPTLMDMMGYNKPFRSWGRSLIRQGDMAPYVVKYINNHYQFMMGDYVGVFDGKKMTGYYHKNDKAMAHNLMQKEHRPEFDQIEQHCKAFIQDYMARIMDRRLGTVQ